MSPDFRKSVCGASKVACKELAAAMDLSKNSTDDRSFAALSSALGRVGSVKHAPSAAFDGNRAFIWSPGDDTGYLKNAVFVVVHARAQRRMLITLSVENDASQSVAPTVPCAIRAAKRAYNNITS